MAFLEGKRIKTVANTGGHNYPATFIFSVKTNNKTYQNNTTLTTFMPTSALSNIAKDYTSGNSIYFREMTLAAFTLSELKEDLEKETKNFFDYKKDIESKIELLEKFGLDEYDDNILKAQKIYKALGLETKEEFQKVYKSIL